MMMQRMVSRSRLIVAVVVGLGLFLLFIGAAFTNAGHTQYVNQTQEQTINNNNLVAVWGPTFMAFGLFLLVGGLLFGAAVLEDLDIFVRLFLMILGFVAVLLILASPATFFP
jgi:hypothetical protein